MSHTLITTKHGYIVASTLAGIVLSASIFDSYGEALAQLIALQGG